MKIISTTSRFSKTTRCRQCVFLGLALLTLFFTSCGSLEKKAEPKDEEEALARTEFTDRIENFFEYTPLKKGKPSQFLIHLTDLTDGTPVEKADVTLQIRRNGESDFNEVKAKVGRVTGIYVAEVEIARKGTYGIEFRIKNDKLNEKMLLKDFEVE